MCMISLIVIEEKIKEIAGRSWFPVEVARVNDQAVRLALFEGEYHWHQHDNEDELFYVYSGKILIQLKDQADITLSAGEVTVVTKGMQHCPKALEPSYVLMFEPIAINSQGKK